MATANPLNVFKGPNGLKQYFDPDAQPPLPLVELPDKLNPFRQDGVRIYAKMLTTLPCQNVKALPALNMLLADPSCADKTLLEVSSGSTITSLGITARVLYDNYDTIACVSNKASIERIRELQFYGLKVLLYGGPTYTETTDPRGPVEWARDQGKSGKVVNLGQYDNVANWQSHERWTGPQLWQQLPEMNVFCMGMGSTGCVTGTGKYLKAQNPAIKLLGVCNDEADLIPGPRERPMHETSPFPWKGVVDYMEDVSSVDSYRVSMRLSREGIISGPSSGMALEGLFKFLHKEKENGTLSRHADPSTGEVSCVFVCCDLPQKHVGTYFDKLPREEFPPMINEELLDVDQDVYSFRWEIDPREPDRQEASIFNQINKTELDVGSQGPASSSSSAPLRFLDIRSRADFEAGHVKGAYNIPLPNLSADSNTPFDFSNIQTLIDQSKDIRALIAGQEVADLVSASKDPLVVVSYNGDTSRVMTAMLRTQGVEAYSFIDGMAGISNYLARQRSPSP